MATPAISKKTTTAKSATVTLDERMEGKIKQACIDAWNYIADDLIACNEGKDISRECVIEAVCDYIHSGTKEKDVIDAFYALDHKVRRKLMLSVFTFKKYGY